MFNLPTYLLVSRENCEAAQVEGVVYRISNGRGSTLLHFKCAGMIGDTSNVLRLHSVEIVMCRPRTSKNAERQQVHSPKCIYVNPRPLKDHHS
jgi:hypothetical protein